MATTPHTVTLPERGTGNVVPASAGAMLLIIFRDLTQPLTSISLYDGLAIQAPNQTFSQPLHGVLQSSAAHPAKLTLMGWQWREQPDRSHLLPERAARRECVCVSEHRDVRPRLVELPRST